MPHLGTPEVPHLFPWLPFLTWVKEESPPHSEMFLTMSLAMECECRTQVSILRRKGELETRLCGCGSLSINMLCEFTPAKYGKPKRAR